MHKVTSNTTFTNFKFTSRNNNKMVSSTIKSDEYEKALQNFISNHNKVVKSNKQSLRNLMEELQAAKTTIIDKNEEIHEVNEMLNLKESEVLKTNTENANLQEEIKKLNAALEAAKEKFSNLETLYDESIYEMNCQHQRLEERCKELEQKNKQLLNELTEKDNNFRAHVEKQRSAEEKLRDCRVEFTALQTTFEQYKVNTEKEHFNKIKNLEEKAAVLKAELETKIKLLDENCAAKLQIEQEKNKIIQEQAYKINEIERVFGQPINRVQANPNVRVGQPAESLNQSNEIDKENIQVNNMMKQPTSFVVPVLRSRSQRKNQQQQQQPKPQEQALFTVGRRRKLSPQYLVENNFSSDDSDSDWHPKLPPLNDTTFASDTEKLKITSVLAREAFVPETSESDNLFDQFKRSKN